MNIPKLRFKEFTDEWNIHKLKDLCTTCGGGTPSKSITEYWTGNIPWISSSNLESNSIFKINISKFITTKAISESATKIIPPNSILIVSRVGVGKVAINYNELCTSQDFTNLINIKSNPIFLTYLLKIKMEKQIQQTQGTSIKGITTNDIKNINCTLPNIKEQEKIANLLATVDKKITNLENTITSLENQKKGLLQQIFSQKLRFKDKNGNNNYTSYYLYELIKDIKSGNNKERIKTGLFPVYGSMGILGYNNNYIYDFTTILIARVGMNAGNVSLVTGKYDVSDNTLIIIPSNKINIYYLYYYLINFNLNKLVFGSGQPLIKASELKKIIIKIPCLEEQTKIADFFSAFDRKLENQKAQLEHWKQIKKGLLQQMFV